VEDTRKKQVEWQWAVASGKMEESTASVIDYLWLPTRAWPTYTLSICSRKTQAENFLSLVGDMCITHYYNCFKREGNFSALKKSNS
jgi:hypothetical protein